MLTRLMLAVALGGTSIIQQTDSSRLVGQEGRFCGVLTKYTHGTSEDKCDVQFELTTSDSAAPLGIVVRRSARPQFPSPPENLFHQDICVSGVVTMKDDKPYVEVTAATQVDVRDRRNVAPFGVGAVSVCDDGTVTLPNLVKEAKPSYTEKAVRARIQGMVVLEAVVGLDGLIGDVRVTKPLDPELDAQAITALRQWVFKPGTRNGRPAPTIIAVEISFALRDRRQ
jgi:TonB family protein